MLLLQWSGRTTLFPAFRETENQRLVTLYPPTFRVEMLKLRVEG